MMNLGARALDLGNPINRDHPLARGLITLCQVFPSRRGSRFLDLANHHHGAIAASGPAWSGSAINFTGTAGGITMGNYVLSKQLPYTQTVRFNSREFSGQWLTTDSADANGMGFGMGANVSGQIEMYGGSWVEMGTGTANKWYIPSYANHTRGDNTSDVYLDGVSNAANAFSAALNNAVIGQKLASLYGAPYNGLLSTYIMHDVALSARLVYDLYNEIRLGYPTLLNRVSPLRTFMMGAAAAATLDGACAIVFTGTNILTGAGALAGASALIFSGTNALSGAGALLGASALIFAGTNTLDGAGALLGSSALIFSGTNTLTGAGALVGSSAVAFSGTNILDGAGALVGSSACIFSGTNTLTGAGALLGTSVVVFTGTDTLVGAGALSGDLAVVFTPTGTLTLPSGGMAGVSAIVFTGTDTLLGAGVLAGASAVVFTGTNTLSGAGSLLGASAVVFGGTATLGGGVGLFGVVTLAFSGTDTLQGSGTLAGAAASVFTLTGNLATGSLLGLSTLVFTASSNLSGNGALLGVLPLVFSAITTSTFPVEFIDIEHAYLEVPGVTRFSEALGTSGYMRPY